MNALSPRPALNIVLVDDDEGHAFNVRRALSRSGAQHPAVFVASDGFEALELLRDGRVPARRRLVLLDIHMPRMNGMEFLQQLRADPALRSTPVVVLTTSDDAQDLTEAYRLNVAGYLLKPESADAMLELMRAVNQYWASAELV